MLDAVYVDTLEEESIVGIQPKPAFLPLFEAAAAGEGTSSVTGSSFFAASEPSGLLRFCFALEDEPLDRACEALAQLG